MESLTEKIRELWSGWEVRVLILLSLLLQIILTVFGSRRKYTRRISVRILVWSAYLTADWVATVALGSLARGNGDSEDNSSKPNNALQAFWAPFLLLHLGGPDTITAYSLEDNNLWLRHFVGLVVQVGVTFYVFYRSWSNSNTALKLTAIPMFITGIIERNFILRSSSSDHFRDSLLSDPDPGPDLIEFDPDEGIKVVHPRDVSATIAVAEEGTHPADNYILQAYVMFKRLSYLFADLILGYYERTNSYSIIHSKSAEDAFKLVAVELGFMYDVLYTKATIVYSRQGIILRCVSFFSSASALVVFSIIIDMHTYPLIDISITYCLLVGAVFFEIYAFIQLLFSDWTKLWFINQKIAQPADGIGTCLSLSYPFLVNHNKRWSGSMTLRNLIGYCFTSSDRDGFQVLLGIDKLVEKYKYLSWVDVQVDLQEFIFRKLLEKGNLVKDDLFSMKLCKELLSQRGDCALQKRNCLDAFRWSTVDTEFDRSLLLWHIATDLCYYDNYGRAIQDNDVNLERKMSKYLSDYMLYLLVVCPSMLPKGIGEIRYRDTCAEAIRFFRVIRSSIEFFDTMHLNLDGGYEALLQVNTHAPLEEMKGDTSQSVLFFGCRLAKQLQSMESRNPRWSSEHKWEMISEVWVEFLAYAASNCGWKEHGQQLRKGGELLTHVCLLMAHLGLSEQYKIQKDRRREISKPPIKFSSSFANSFWCLCGTLILPCTCIQYWGRKCYLWINNAQEPERAFGVPTPYVCPPPCCTPTPYPPPCLALMPYAPPHDQDQPRMRRFWQQLFRWNLEAEG